MYDKLNIVLILQNTGENFASHFGDDIMATSTKFVCLTGMFVATKHLLY